MNPRTFSLALMVIFVVAVASTFAVIILSGPGTATLVFKETGLPAGRGWAVAVGKTTYTSSTDTISITLLPGVYPYRVSLTNGTDYVAEGGSGFVDLLVPGMTLYVVFVRSQATVTVVEAGLPAGTSWTVAVGSQFFNSNTTSMDFTHQYGNHTLRFYPTLARTLNNIGPVWVDDDFYLPSPSWLNISVNGTGIRVPVRFDLAVHMNSTMFAVPVFPNDTALGSPAYAYRAFTFYRYALVNFSFSGLLVGSVRQNLSAYLMTPSEFAAFAATGNASRYVLTTGNVSEGNVNMTFASGTWYFVATGWSVDEYRSYSLSWVVTLPGAKVYLP